MKSSTSCRVGPYLRRAKVSAALALASSREIGIGAGAATGMRGEVRKRSLAGARGTGVGWFSSSGNSSETGAGFLNFRSVLGSFILSHLNRQSSMLNVQSSVIYCLEVIVS